MQRERQKKMTRMEGISILTELGFSRRDAARALHHASGNMDKAYSVSHLLLSACVCVEMQLHLKLLRVSVSPVAKLNRKKTLSKDETSYSDESDPDVF